MSTPTVTAKANNAAYDVSATQWNAVVNAVKNQPYSYIIYKDGVNCCAKNGMTGTLTYGGASNAGGVDGGVPSAVIQASLNNLTAGRTWQEKVVLQGNIECDAEVLIPSYTYIEICGVLKAADNLDDSLLRNATSDGVADAYTAPGSSNTDITITGSMIDGNKPNMGAGDDSICTIHMQGVDNLLIHHLKMVNGWTEGIRTAFCNNVQICNCELYDAADDCLAFNKETLYAVAANNICLNAGQSDDYGSPCGIEVQDGSQYINIIGNYIENPLQNAIQVSTHAGEASCHFINIIGNTVKTTGSHAIATSGLVGDVATHINISNNVVEDSAAVGIAPYYADKVKVSGNRVSNSGTYGIYVNYAQTQNIFIKNNEVYGSASQGISTSSSVTGMVEIKGNVCYDNDVGIGLSGDNTWVTDNTCYNTGFPQRYGVVFYAGGDNNFCYRNRFYNHSVSPLANAGTGNDIRWNSGYVTENSGSATILSGASTVTFAHGLTTTPTFVLVSGANAEVKDVFVYSLSSANIRADVGAAVSDNRTIYWQAEYNP